MVKVTKEDMQKFSEIIPIEHLDTLEMSHLQLIDATKCGIWNLELLTKCYYDYIDIIQPNIPALKNKVISRVDFNKAIVNLSQKLTFMVPLLIKWEADYQFYLVFADKAGVVIVDPGLNFVLLVEAYGHKGAWSFAKSKKEPWKSFQQCAVDECSEELGLQVTVETKDFTQKYLKLYSKEMNRKVTTMMRLYYVFDVSMERKFKAKTRKEVQNAAWFRISCLANSSEQALQQRFGFSRRSASVIKLFAEEIHERCEQKKTELIGEHQQHEGQDMVNKQSLIDETV